jgi:hypothetical protein
MKNRLQMIVKKKRSPRALFLIAIVITFGVVGICGIMGISIGKSLCIIRPDSLRNPPTPPGAQQIELGKSRFKPYEGFEGKLVQFQTLDSPNEIYTFYQQSLTHDGWQEDAAQHVTTGSNRVDAKFDWVCGFDSANIFATLWFHSEVVATNKTVVTLNYEYLP